MAKPTYNCRNPYIGHDWIKIPDEWVPDTGFPWVKWANQRCGECGLTACRMISALGVRASAYKNYPKDYKYNEGEAPDAIDFFDWWLETPERSSRRRGRQQQPQRHLQAVTG